MESLVKVIIKGIDERLKTEKDIFNRLDLLALKAKLMKED